MANLGTFDEGSVLYEHRGPITVITISRPEVRNAVDEPTAAGLFRAFELFEDDDDARVAVLTGAGETFCAGADLRALSQGRENRVRDDGPGPMGPTRMVLAKPVIAAVEGYAVAGGMELALWCDLRVAARNAVFGVFNRRWGVPLVDGGTFRLPRIVGMGRAMELILTGRPMSAEEAYQAGLVNAVTEPGQALDAAVQLATRIARFPQTTLNCDRLAAYEASMLPTEDAIRAEFRWGMKALASGEALEGARRFARGAGRHGNFEDI